MIYQIITIVHINELEVMVHQVVNHLRIDHNIDIMYQIHTIFEIDGVLLVLLYLHHRHRQHNLKHHHQIQVVVVSVIDYDPRHGIVHQG